MRRRRGRWSQTESRGGGGSVNFSIDGGILPPRPPGIIQKEKRRGYRKNQKRRKTTKTPKKEQILARSRDLLEGALATGNVNGDDCKCGDCGEDVFWSMIDVDASTGRSPNRTQQDPTGRKKVTATGEDGWKVRDSTHSKQQKKMSTMHIGSYKSVGTHSDGVGAGLSSRGVGWGLEGVSWGDMMLEEHPELVGPLGQIDHRNEAEMEETFMPLGLDRVSGCDFFLWDTSEMSDGNYRRLMEWVYWHGWEVEEESRTRLSAWPGYHLCRKWAPRRVVVEVEEEITEETRKMLEREREEELWQRERAERRFKKGSGSGGARAVATRVAAAPVKTVATKVIEELSAPGSDVGRRNGCPVFQFCKEGRACPTAGCRYVHGDTIPVKETCCGGPRDGPHAGDPAYCSKRVAPAGRTPCIFLHPDQTWTADLVVRRA